VPFEAPDGQPVSHIFVLLVPEAANEQHLQLLSEFAQLFSDRSFRDQLAQAPNAATMQQLCIGLEDPLMERQLIVSQLFERNRERLQLYLGQRPV
jgi:mannitol/fructose-specific phosphotransferase system IIA component (Ntr-type)